MRFFLLALAALFSIGPAPVHALSKTDLAERKRASQSLGTVKIYRDRAIVSYRDRLEFFTVPEGTTIDGPGNFVIGAKRVAPTKETPNKIHWFSRPFSVNTQSGSPRFLICTGQWARKQGTRGPDDFCGVLDYSGNTTFQFSIAQSSSNILFPLGLSMDGNYAEVYLGSIVGSEDGGAPGAPREILVWEHPDKVSRRDAPWKTGKPKDSNSAYEAVRRGAWQRIQEYEKRGK